MLYNGALQVNAVRLEGNRIWRSFASGRTPMPFAACVAGTCEMLKSKIIFVLWPGLVMLVLLCMFLMLEMLLWQAPCGRATAFEFPVGELEICC